MAEQPRPGSARLPKRWRAVAVRWCEIGIYALVGYTVALAGVRRIDCKLVLNLPLHVGVATALLVLVGVWNLARPNYAAWLGLKWSYFYPATWVAGVLGASAVLGHVLLRPVGLLSRSCGWLQPDTKEVLRALYFAGSIAVAPLLVVFATSAILLGLRKRVRSVAATEAGKPRSFKEWLSNDAPIVSATEDRFEHAALAAQITQLVTSEDAPPLALVGELGSGKSSILNLVKETLSLRTARDVQFVPISLWPYGTAEAAIGGVLMAVTRGLAQHINTVPLRGVEREYLDAIEGAGGSLGKLIRLAGSSAPSEVLARYDRVAEAIGLRLVLWVEDFERFAGLHRGVAEPEYVRLAPLRALLSELSSRTSIQVVLASSAADYRFDIEKLARYVFSIPTPRIEDVTAQVEGFRKECLLNHQVIDAATQKARAEVWPTEVTMAGWLLAWFPMTVPKALGTLCANPRTLKQALRACSEAWEKLHGEIDFDELLVLSVLRATAPDVPLLMNKYINELKAGVPEVSLPRLRGRSGYAASAS